MRSVWCLAAAGTMVLATQLHAAELDFALGKALFDRLWTSSPASTDATDGLGPLFNARSCATCHAGGGRGAFQEDENGRITGTGLVLRIGNHRGEGDPVYGIQLQTQAVQGLRAEGTLVRTPTGHVRPQALSQGELHKDSRTEGRLAPALHGLGLLGDVPEEAILAWADPADRDGDGISGRANYDDDGGGQRTIGRYGWKAGEATIKTQSAAAAHTDLGLSNPLHPAPYGDCTPAQQDCRSAPHGNSPRFDDLEIDGTMLDMIVAYVSALPPPEAEADEGGLALFQATGCAACHRPNLPTGDGGTIRAYTGPAAA